MTSKTTPYYDALLDRLPGIDEALCWTVVRGVDKPITVEQVVSRIGGDPATLTERDWWAAYDEYPASVVHLAQVGPAVTMFEVNGGEGRRPEVLRWLSDGACVHSVYWHVNGADRLMYAAYGRVLTEVDVFSPDIRHGESPAALDDDVTELIAICENEEGSCRPAAMAVVEARTGVRLPMEWFEQPRLSVVITNPVPHDPRPPTSLARMDPDLHVWLKLAARDVRRAALARMARLLAGRFDLTDEPAVSQACEVLASGTEPAAFAALNPLRWRLQSDFDAVRDQGPIEENPAWWRMQAAMAISAALTPPGRYPDPLDALNHASAALQADWPSLRDELRRLARTNSVPEADR